jgi:putative membrane protein insertion efficiency factor
MMKNILILLVKAYQLTISPLLGSNCRFYPSCSHYMIEAIEKKGAIKGLYLGIKRLSKCHPWGSSGIDPVPPCTCDHQKKKES